MKAPASITMVLSSSVLTNSARFACTDTPIRRRNRLAMTLTSHTIGYDRRSSGRTMYAAGKAMRSGCIAAKVFGATSAKIRMTSTSSPAATLIARSP